MAQLPIAFKMHCRLWVLLLICQLIIRHTAGQLSIDNLMAFEPELPVQHAMMDKMTGNLYLGGTNFVYHLNSNLSLIAVQSSITADISNFCVRGEDGCALPEGSGENENRVLLIDRENNFLMACGTAFNGTCVLHHLEDIQTVEARVHDVDHYEESSLGIGESVVAFFGTTTSNYRGRTDNVLGIYTGMSFNPLFNGTLIRQHAVSTKCLRKHNNRWTLDLAYQELEFGRYTFIDLREEYAHTYPIEYVSGFSWEEFNYFTTVQRVDVDQEAYESRLVRICSLDIGYYSYTEIPLQCISRDRTRTYNLLQAAHFGPIGSDMAKRLRTASDEYALYGIFAESSESAPNKPTGHSALCIFTMKKVSRKIRDGLQGCFNGYGYQGLRHFSANKPCSYATYRVVDENFCGTGDLHPIEADASLRSYDYLRGGGHGHHYTSITIRPMGRDTIVVLGTRSGMIHKFILEPLSFTPGPAGEPPLLPYKKIKLDSDGPVLRDMPFDLDKSHVFAMTPNKVYKIGLRTCDHYTHCSDCVTSNDPNRCGWCGGVCTTQAECENMDGGSGDIPEEEVDSEDGPEWVTDACAPVIYEVSPVFGPLQGDTLVHIIGDSLASDSPNVNITLNVTVAGQPCDVILNISNITHILCVMPPVEDPIQGPAVVDVLVDMNLDQTFAIGGTASSEPNYIYSYVEPVFTHFSPMAGPLFGGTNLIIHGSGLLAGNTRQVAVAGVPCLVHRVTATKLHCTTQNTSQPTSGPVLLSLDSLELPHTLAFEYKENPYVTDFSPKKSFFSGDIPLEISGFNLHLGQSVRIEVEAVSESGHRVRASKDCTLPTIPDSNAIPDLVKGALTCPAPDLSDSGLVATPDQPIVANLTVMFHKRILQPMSEDGQIVLPQWELVYYPDPILDEFEEKILVLDQDSSSIIIHGEYLDLVSNKDQVLVTVGNQQCAIQELQSTFIKCEVPAELQASTDDSNFYEVQVTIGGVQEYNVGMLQVPKKPGPQAHVAGTIIAIVALVAVVFIIIVIVVRCRYKSKRRASMPIDNTHAAFNAMETAGEVHLATQGPRVNTYLTNPGSPIDGAMPIMQRPLLEQINNELAAEISQVLIHEESIGLGKVLGSGHFGCVYAGKLTQDGKENKVAVKSLHQGSLHEITCFLREGIMMKDFKHRNVLALIGVCISSDTNMPYVILPFMQNGDILTYVRDPSNELTARQLLEFCRQISEGMQYLSSLKFVHRDLAARNCMLDEDLVVKVADFGLSRDIYERDYYSAKDRSAKLPVRWMAMECLERNIYNTKTDVWSFGVVMWELLTRGIVPYPTVDNIDILKFLHSGNRLYQPDHCPDHVYEVMMSCWSVSPVDRPSFTLLVDKLDEILTVKSKNPVEREQSDTYVNVPGTSGASSS
ncbi:hepatocyte growth factor receptor-like [Diadema setosum]|uniref:hepatocyte growth factor receptor-like n=1 Tax=Diadema setosum TaxID=31175 RepID=UPI003B3B3E4E